MKISGWQLIPKRAIQTVTVKKLLETHRLLFLDVMIKVHGALWDAVLLLAMVTMLGPVLQVVEVHLLEWNMGPLLLV
jgi:hypothetical protein